MKKNTCPTCGCPVRVVGKTTKHYEPDVFTIDEMGEQFQKGMEGGERIALVGLKAYIERLLKEGEGE